MRRRDTSRQTPDHEQAPTMWLLPMLGSRHSVFGDPACVRGPTARWLLVKRETMPVDSPYSDFA